MSSLGKGQTRITFLAGEVRSQYLAAAGASFNAIKQCKICFTNSYIPSSKELAQDRSALLLSLPECRSTSSNSESTQSTQCRNNGSAYISPDRGSALCHCRNVEHFDLHERKEMNQAAASMRTGKRMPGGGRIATPA